MNGFQSLFDELRDPLKFIHFLWPDIQLYDKEMEMVYSVKRNTETYVKAANMMGKDFTAGLIVLGAFLNPPAFLLHEDDAIPESVQTKIITTSVKDEHLDVLWGEMDRFIRTSRLPLRVEDGGPLVYLHREIRKVMGGQEVKDSYLKGQVCKKGEGFAGHHAPYTLLVCDECSGIEDLVYSMGQGWMKRFLAFGNPNQCENFYRKACDGGDVIYDDGVDAPAIVSRSLSV